MASSYTGPGLLYVGSRTKPSTGITDETYNKWYDDVHVPHILETSGVQSVVRYAASHATANECNWPFLAIYPIRDLHYLTTEEFASIPLTDDLLPGPSHSCVDCADFDQRHYATIGEFQVGEVNPGSAPKLLVSHFHAPEELGEAKPTKILEWYSQQQGKGANQHVQLYKLILARRFQDNSSVGFPSFIALHHLPDYDSVLEVLGRIRSPSASVAVYDVWKEFGSPE
ncbi:uncharacterized protein BJX67DRAFT_377860 [Aspergillus lucknowensis]|uniref:EthD domain-containing protein n=1 Tax=Aspergillus lucknowensis TaxID=176173 RepID=A0ABR4M3U4_9EURO